VTAADADRIIGLYERHADTWDRQRSRTLFEKLWLDRFADLLPANGAVLDIGCGTGEPIGAYLAEKGFSVIGVDSSPTMIAKARQRMPTQGWHVADMRSLALDRRFDGILAWDSFFHLAREDQRAMFRVFEAHAAPTSALMFTSGPADGEAMGTFEGEPLYHASLAPDAYRRLLSQIGFAVVTHIADDPDCGGHTIWLARRV
jgi:SAM-dependent methyltransferase